MQSETYQYYELANNAKNKYRDIVLGAYTKVMKRLQEAEVNYDISVSIVTKELDSGTTSKTALSSLVKGDARVIESKAEVYRWKTQVKLAEEQLKFIKMEYDLQKKAMDAEQRENFGGG